MAEISTAPKLEMLKSTEQVEAYLSSITDSSFPEPYRSPTSVIQLTTGIANGIHRLTFPKFHHNQLAPSAILKHSTPYVFNINGQTIVWDLWPYELYALQDVPNTEFVKTPKVLWIDEVNHVMITEDAGPKSITLKNLLLGENIPKLEVFRKIGEELGIFLAKLHSWGKDEAVLKKYENKDSRVIASWRTFGRLEQALAEACPGVSEERMNRVKAYCEVEKGKALSGKDMVIMGDFWTGNVLVNLTEGGDLESLYIVDWEMVRPADAATEISQMVAETWEGGEFGKNPNAKIAARDLTVGLCTAYREGMRVTNDSMLRDVMLGAASHVLVWVSIGFAKEGNADQFKAAKAKALEIMWEAFNDAEIKHEDWGFTSLV
ncbi:hypothetical protein ABW19_dt0202364 [Dactylella cylindrospora]|nr:hypothetical protein ABW19_dt0202364 [Dactylella cylindrospora]